MSDPESFRSYLEELKTRSLPMDESQRTAMRDLSRLVGELGPTACEVLVYQAERLAMGAKQYGDFGDKRDWLQEGLAELADLGAYLAMAVKDAKTKRDAT